ncbi:MAG: S8 family serine peptidase [Acidimicrobiales bacterium]
MPGTAVEPTGWFSLTDQGAGTTMSFSTRRNTAPHPSSPHRAGRRRRPIVAVAAAVALGLAFPLFALPAAGQTPPAKPAPVLADRVPGELLVRFEPSVSAAGRDRVRQRHALTKVRDLPLPGLELVKTPENAPIANRAAAVSAEPGVRYAEPNFVYQPSAVIPNDPDFPELWGFHNTGQTGGTPDKDIDAPEAWEVASGTEALVVGVIDTGVDISHPDLAGTIWVNPGEVAGNGIDDDANGYIDDINGWDFFNNDNTVFDQADGDEHGTHVAGTIAAIRDNATLVAGVSQARIMSLKFIGPTSGSTSNAILAIQYAVNKGAKLTNNSWGGGGFSQSLTDAIEVANGAGQPFVAAAGNGGADGVGDNNDTTPDYPSNYANANIIAVAATDHNDALGSFSNYGLTQVDLGAPGVGIVSTVPSPRTFKAVLTGPPTSPGTPYYSAFHGFGLEGVLDPADRQAILSAALTWSGTASSAPILVVDDDTGVDADEGLDFKADYTAPLASLGFTSVATSTVTACNSGPSAAALAAYSVVIWFTGPDFSCPLTATDQTSLTTYLDAGGNLLLFGQDIAYDLSDRGRVTNTFLQDKLRTNFISDRDGEFDLVGVPGSPYNAVGAFDLDPNSGAARGQSAAEVITPRTGAVGAVKPATPVALANYSGTSMASPLVAGALAHVYGSYPGITMAAARSRIIDRGDPAAALAGKTVSGKRLNLAKSLDTASSPVISATSATPASIPVGGTTSLGWTLNEPSDVTITLNNAATPATILRTQVLGARPASANVWAWDGKDGAGVNVPAASYQLKVVATDVLGAVTSATVPVTVTAGGAVQKPPADFDGNGSSDKAVFRPSTGQWFVRGGSPEVTQYGVSGDIPVPGDYDGGASATTDKAVYRPSAGQWFVRGGSPEVTHYGVSGDIPVPGDYDGNGTTDKAVYRPSTGQWFVRGGSPEVTQYGAGGDQPQPGNYDGNATTDKVVYRPSTGQWFVRGGSPEVTQYGAGGDVALPLPYAIRSVFFP